MTRPKVDPDKRIRTAQACDSCKRRKQKNGPQKTSSCHMIPFIHQFRRSLPMAYDSGNVMRCIQHICIRGRGDSIWPCEMDRWLFRTETLIRRWSSQGLWNLLSARL
ncbi:hypothetical protein BKA61DRAFT_229477 [Leptodontidium sp. MPI-SDFR-AT-0119]|nr:hypothetical protein BKA61DRAFT_229477 [Leptodontidium sp. MPI-SDFR-AT-0119]